MTLPPQRCRRITFPAPYGGAIDLHQMLLDLLLVLMGSIRGCESLVQALFNEGNVHDSSQIQTVCTAWCIQFRWQYRRITKLIEEKMHFTEQTTQADANKAQSDSKSVKPEANWGGKLFFGVLIAVLVFFWWVLIYSGGVVGHHS